MHVFADAVDLAVDEPLKVRIAGVAGGRGGVEVEHHDVGRGHQFRRARARQQVLCRVFRMAGADVPEAVNHALARENVVGDDQVGDGLCEIGGGH